LQYYDRAITHHLCKLAKMMRDVALKHFALQKNYIINYIINYLIYYIINFDMTRVRREYVRNILPPFAIFSKYATIIAIRSLVYCELWPYRLTVRTSGFHPGNRGSIPRRVTNIITAGASRRLLCW
jgi:hypothetical protein